MMYQLRGQGRGQGEGRGGEGQGITIFHLPPRPLATVAS